MPQLARSGLVALTVAALASAAGAQVPPAGKAAPPAAKAARPPAPNPAVLNQVLATVNGEPITRREVLEFLGQYGFASNDQKEIYDGALNALIDTKVLTQFLNRQKIQVPAQQVDQRVAAIEKDLQVNNQTLAGRMAETGTSLSELRKKIEQRLRWSNYLMSQATDAALRKFSSGNSELLNGTQVKASHILLSVAPDASAADKEKVKQKLVGIKKDIEAGKTTFAEAADKFSEDPANTQSKVGGDLGMFPRKGHFIEPFAAAAFRLKKGQISEPIETPFGYHLILVTDRQEGKPIDFAQARDEILNMYAADLQERIITTERDKAKVDKKPMPSDLFQPPPGTAPAPGAPAPKAAPPR